MTQLDNMLVEWRATGKVELLSAEHPLSVPVGILKTEEQRQEFFKHIDDLKEKYGSDVTNDENALAACIYALLRTNEKYHVDLNTYCSFITGVTLKFYDKYALEYSTPLLQEVRKTIEDPRNSYILSPQVANLISFVLTRDFPLSFSAPIDKAIIAFCDTDKKAQEYVLAIQKLSQELGPWVKFNKFYGHIKVYALIKASQNLKTPLSFEQYTEITDNLFRVLQHTGTAYKTLVEEIIKLLGNDPNFAANAEKAFASAGVLYYTNLDAINPRLDLFKILARNNRNLVKAFNNVPSALIHYRLKGYGFRGQFINLFASLLIDNNPTVHKIKVSDITAEYIDQYIKYLEENPNCSESELRLNMRNARLYNNIALADRIQQHINSRFPFNQFRRLRNIFTQSIFDARNAIISKDYARNVAYATAGVTLVVFPIAVIVAWYRSPRFPLPPVEFILAVSIPQVPTMIAVATTTIASIGLAATVVMIPAIGVLQFGKNLVKSAFGLNEEENLDRKFSLQGTPTVAVDDNDSGEDDDLGLDQNLPQNHLLSSAQGISFTNGHRNGSSLNQLAQQDVVLEQLDTLAQANGFTPPRAQNV